MQIKPEQLENHLARGLKPIYTIHGDEALLAQEAGDAIRAAARAAGYGERRSLSPAARTSTGAACSARRRR